jgi:hypothetical protein
MTILHHLAGGAQIDFEASRRVRPPVHIFIRAVWRNVYFRLEVLLYRGLRFKDAMPNFGIPPFLIALAVFFSACASGRSTLLLHVRTWITFKTLHTSTHIYLESRASLVSRCAHVHNKIQPEQGVINGIGEWIIIGPESLKNLSHSIIEDIVHQGNGTLVQLLESLIKKYSQKIEKRHSMYKGNRLGVMCVGNLLVKWSLLKISCRRISSIHEPNGIDEQHSYVLAAREGGACTTKTMLSEVDYSGSSG